MSRRALLTPMLVWLAAACAGAARSGGSGSEPSKPVPAADTGEAAAGDTLRPGTYEPFEPAATARDTAAARAPQPLPSPRTQPAAPAVPAAPDAPDAGPVAAYVIQVAAFGEREPAEDVALLLRRRYPDYPARVVARAGLFRVWLGGWPTRAEAASVLLIVRQRHPDAWVVAP